VNREDSVNETTRPVKLLIALRVLWRRKWTVVAGTVLFTLLGAVYSLLAPHEYMARAVIYPQDISANSDKSGIRGGLGALNPVLGISQLNRVEILLKSRDMARRVIIKERLLPLLLPDIATGKDTLRYKGTKLQEGARVLQSMISTQVDVYKMTLEIRVRAEEAGVAFRIARAYLEALNDRMKEGVIRNADANREFLESQMAKTADPWSREKIQQLIINEIETSMLLNAHGFEVLEDPEVPPFRESPRRKRIVMASMFFGFLVSCFGVLAARAVGNLKADMGLSGG
jgi:uncharacterized protein involved in exopolysaccharide biosynthesis